MAVKCVRECESGIGVGDGACCDVELPIEQEAVQCVAPRPADVAFISREVVRLAEE